MTGTGDLRHCPQCGAEYHAGIAECSDCRVPLVDEAPAIPQKDLPEDVESVLDPRSLNYVYDPRDWPSDIQPARLTSVGSEAEAEMLVGFLQSNELRAFAQNETSHGISHYGGQAARSGALALYRIYVHPEDETTARELLDESERTQAEAEIGAGDDVLAEPARQRRWTTGVAAFLVLLLTFPAGAMLWFLWNRFFG